MNQVEDKVNNSEISFPGLSPFILEKHATSTDGTFRLINILFSGGAPEGGVGAVAC